MLRLGGLNCLRYLAYITNLLSFIVSYKICAKFGFHMFVQKLHEFHVKLIWTIFVHIQYPKYSNRW